MGISVIIPLYNKAPMVSRAITSALQQDVEAEVIVVDDGSTDGSDRIARSFEDRIVYIRQKNAGPSAAPNRGVNSAKYTGVAFLDADDEFLPGCLAAHLACRKARPGIGLSFSPFRCLRGESVIWEEWVVNRLGDLETLDGCGFAGNLQVGSHTGLVSGSFCVDAKLYKEIDGFDPDLRCWEITDFIYRLVRHSPRVCVLKEVFVHIHQQKSSSQFDSNFRMIKFRKIYTQKLIQDLENLSKSDRKPVLTDIKDNMKFFLTERAVDDFKEIASKVRDVADEDRELKNLCALSRTPNAVVHGAVAAWRLLQFTKQRRVSR
jgi:glycosyltransferase involved in cell wall biosynthesis